MNKEKLLRELSNEYKETYLKLAEIKEHLDALKAHIKEVCGSDDYRDDIIQVKHYETKRINYAAFIKNRKIEIPEDYKSITESVKITLRK